MECRLHPGIAAVATCEECERPICETCRAKSAQRPLCYSCSFDHEPAAGALDTPMPGLADDLGLTVPDGPGVRGVAGSAVRYLIAFLLTGGVATTVGLAWWKFTSLIGHESIYFAVFAAAAVGFVPRLAYGGRSGCLLPFLGAGMAAYCILLHHTLTVQDRLMEDVRTARLLGQMALADRVLPLLMNTVASLTPLGWLILVAGAVIGAVMPYFSRPIGMGGALGAAVSMNRAPERNPELEPPRPS